MDLHIKDVIKKYIKDEPIGDIYHAQKIRSYISKEMSPSISSRISSVDFKDGRLTLYVDSAPLRHDLFNNRDTIRKKINDFLDGEVVRLVTVSS